MVSISGIAGTLTANIGTAKGAIGALGASWVASECHSFSFNHPSCSWHAELSCVQRGYLINKASRFTCLILLGKPSYPWARLSLSEHPTSRVFAIAHSLRALQHASIRYSQCHGGGQLVFCGL